MTFVPLDKKPEAVQKRGDRISIFRPDAERLLNLPDVALVMLLRALLQWFKDGSDARLEDPMADCCLQSLKEAQLRIVAEVWRKHETNKANRGKARGKSTNDGRLPSSTVDDDGQQSSSVDDSGRQAEAQAPAQADAQAPAQAIVKAPATTPKLEEVIAWGKSEMISEEFLKGAYDELSNNGWTSKGGKIGDWHKYLKAWSNRVGGGVRESHNRMLDEMSDTDRSWWNDTRKALAVRYFAKRHGRKMTKNENGNLWPEPFDFLREMKVALREYDEAIDRGECDVYYRSRYQ